MTNKLVSLLGFLSATALSLALAAPAQAAPGPEKAEWRLAASTPLPQRRHMHGLAFDDARGVLVAFGGANGDGYRNDIWEFDGTTWKERVVPGSNKPEARAGAGVVWDASRGKLIVIGGHSFGGSYFEDVWEWDPASNTWLDRTGAGAKPRARAFSSMVFDKTSKKVFLFAGGHGDFDDIQGPSLPLGDTWEWDPATGNFTERKLTPPAIAPSPRLGAGFVWDTKRGRGVLFGGLTRPDVNADPVPKQDTWDFDPAMGWLERTTAGAKPSARFGHAMAFDGTRNKTVVFSGYNIAAGDARRDVWEWDGASTWSERTEVAAEALPPGKMSARMVWDSKRGSLWLFGGFNQNGETTIGNKIYPEDASRELWEQDPATGKWTDREAPSTVPADRRSPAVAFDVASGKVVLFGGVTPDGRQLDDTWEWDGQKWTDRSATKRPPARAGGAMTYDPARKTVLLLGGTANDKQPPFLMDQWEYTGGTWSAVTSDGGPRGRDGVAITTDSARGKVLAFGGFELPFRGGPRPIFMNPAKNDVWEWDGQKWTDRTPPAGAPAPAPRRGAVAMFDEARRKLIIVGGLGEPIGTYWEWDVDSGGWAEKRATGGSNMFGFGQFLGAFDALRRRGVLFANNGPDDAPRTFDLDPVAGTLLARTIKPIPSNRDSPGFAFDAARGIAVLVGGEPGGDETWELSITNHPDGTGCAAATAARCASGFCVDGVCCEMASCGSGCRACNVPGNLGKCSATKPGAQVTSQCTGAQACDGTGACKAANGQACTSGDACASGFCADGVCCDTACTGACQACNLARPGVCSAHAVGTDPDKDCAGMGTGTCAASCDGVGACRFPSAVASCGTCGRCDNMGTCREPGVCPPDGGVIFPPPVPRDAGRPASDAPFPFPVPPGGPDGSMNPAPGSDAGAGAAGAAGGRGPGGAGGAGGMGGGAGSGGSAAFDAALAGDTGGATAGTGGGSTTSPTIGVDAGLTGDTSRPTDGGAPNSVLANGRGCDCTLAGAKATSSSPAAAPILLGAALLGWRLRRSNRKPRR